MGGTRADPGGGRAHVHACEVFDDLADFRANAVGFLADGLARGCRVRYMAEGDVDALRRDLAPLEDLPQARRPGAVEVRSLSAVYAAPGALVDAEAQVATFAADTQAALDDGFTGLRVAANATSLVRTPEQLEAFARYEHRADRLMTTVPFSGLCALDRSVLGDDAVAELACLHARGGGDPAFRVHATRDADLALSGELDLVTVDLFATTMERVGLSGATGEFVVDAGGLAFADHRNLLVLERLARRHDRTVVLRTGRRWPGLLVSALELRRVRVEHRSCEH